jgi:hypothetical protein
MKRFLPDSPVWRVYYATDSSTVNIELTKEEYELLEKFAEAHCLYPEAFAQRLLRAALRTLSDGKEQLEL